MSTHFRETPYGSSEYQTTLELRQRVLRQPLGLDLYQENLQAEKHQRHFSVWQPPAQLLACVVIVPLANACVKLRQMAVNPDFRNQGLGRQLIGAVENLLFNDGVKQIELHARVEAELFYKACGYQADGDIFEEVGIPHRRMSKVLVAASSAGTPD